MRRFPPWAVAAAALALACGGGGAGIDTAPDGDVPDVDPAAADPGDAEPGAPPEAVQQGVFAPRDGRLWAATAVAVVTPDAENHPCVAYFGGSGYDLHPTGVDNDLEARVLVLEQDGTPLVLATLDILGWSLGDVQKVWALLDPLGVPRDRIVVTATHTHRGPDTMGVFGPDSLTTGRCPEYQAFLASTIAGLVTQVSGRMVAVEPRAAETVVHEPASNFPDLMNDIRPPHVVNDHLTVARFVDAAGATVASLVNWHSHPEAFMETKGYSADFPRWVREKVEGALGGTCLYLSGTLGGMITPIGVDVPGRDESGAPLLDGGAPVLVADRVRAKARSLGFVVAEHAIPALQAAERLEGALAVDREHLFIPVDTFLLAMAFKVGIIAQTDQLVFGNDHPEECDATACVHQDLLRARLGRLHLVTLPGEVLPETSVGRPSSSHDWEGTWGVREYPAMTGYRASLPAGDLLIEIGLANNEMGYLLPATDILPDGHPGVYEEQLCVGPRIEGLVREGIGRLLAR
jgi:hypothetical protein